MAWDGHRVTIAKVGEVVRVFADDMREWTERCAPLVLAIRELPADEVVLEGFLCVLDPQGRPDFEALKERMHSGKGRPLVFMAWDCLQIDGESCAALSLGQRRSRLSQLMTHGAPGLALSEPLEGAVSTVCETVSQLGFPGVFCRHLDEALGEVVVLADGQIELDRPLSAAPRVTNSTKVLFPRDGLTKEDIVGYYRDVAPVLLPYLRARPVVAQRWPDGIDAFTWYQHRVPPRAPDYLKAINIDGNRRLLLHSPEALLWMVNQAAITFHGWSSRVDTLEQPDWAILDLDPGSTTTWRQVIEVAQAIRALFELLEVASVVKTSGQKGLHILVPLAGGHSLAETHEFAARVSQLVARLLPDVVSLSAEASHRRGRLFLDHLQSFKGKSLVLPYSVRAADGAPISTPISWDEVEPGLSPKAFTVRTMRRRLDARGDLAQGLLQGSLKLASVLPRLRER